MSIEKYLKNKGIARDRKQANIIMIALIIICLFIIITVSKKDNSKDTINEEALSAEEIELMELETFDDIIVDENFENKKDQ